MLTNQAYTLFCMALVHLFYFLDDDIQPNFSAVSVESSFYRVKLDAAKIYLR